MNKKYITQCILAAILIFTGIGFQYLKDDSAEYLALIKQLEDVDAKGIKINLNTTANIKVLNRIVESSPKSKWVFNKVNSISEIVDDFSEMLELLESELFIHNPSKSNTSKPSWLLDEEIEAPDKFPFNYNKTTPVKTTFIKNKKAELLCEQWEKTLDTLKKIIQLDTISNKINSKKINLYYPQQNEVLENNVDALTLLNDVQQFKKMISKYDVIHTALLLKAFDYELQLIGLQLIDNLSPLVNKNSFLEIDFLFKISSRDIPVVNKPYYAEIFLANRGKISTPVKMQIQEKDIEVKDGIGLFSYTPKKKGTNHIRTMIQMQNPFTGGSMTFKKTETFWVY